MHANFVLAWCVNVGGQLGTSAVRGQEDAGQSAERSPIPVKTTGSVILGFYHFKVLKYADQSCDLRCVFFFKVVSTDSSQPSCSMLTELLALIQQLHGNS